MTASIWSSQQTPSSVPVATTMLSLPQRQNSSAKLCSSECTIPSHSHQNTSSSIKFRPSSRKSQNLSFITHWLLSISLLTYFPVGWRWRSKIHKARLSPLSKFHKKLPSISNQWNIKKSKKWNITPKRPSSSLLSPQSNKQNTISKSIETSFRPEFLKDTLQQSSSKALCRKPLNSSTVKP